MNRLIRCLFIVALLSNAGMAQEWISLFDGTSLDGWKANEDPACFTVEDGAIKVNGPRCHLFYDGEVQGHDFKNFEFEIDVKTEPGTNSGIFIHTAFQKDGWPSQGYEVQVNNSQKFHNGYYENKKTGSLYGIRNVYKPLVNDNEWFTMKITVQGKRVLIALNGTIVVDYTEPAEPVRDSHHTTWVLSSGTFALQCHDPGSVSYYKNIRVKPLPDDLDGGGTPPVVDDVYRQIMALQINNFPMLDLHVHLKGGLSIEDALNYSNQVGIQYGIAANCGVGFPIQDDQGIEDYLANMKGQPVFVAMQAEGREWVNTFSKEAVAKFDYVFSDCMTFTDDQGRRTRLWMPDEVWVDDPQAFMDMLVKRTVGVMSEGIDIYVNPTYLPAVIADRYDELWTEERMMRVIQAAKTNNVAVEINSRFKLPSAKFVALAKKSGVKFTLGTNNGGADDLGRLEYSLEIIRDCKLSWTDMFVPLATY
jgi:hypothetical protein